ncbi:STAS domain-containing protein [Pseudohoeflea coraliihabitans]|uniref:STAS domain-containing protein n=1 Tax=Pseudohoeflea coraliihabitans TaxID=2860393 RepID=A0ABS6WN59_9HYPH|nr:STAS domain-containing protein [Pseudohoeflea sp. DP4N28-3]MBW3097396.1 STAS domain-containing protein [Pseudohoeflea sp. DP4N28-3]
MTELNEGPHILKLPAILDLNAASRLHEQVLALQDKDVAIDASEVSRVGAQCVQVLLSAAASWRAADRQFTVKHSSEIFAKTLTVLGVTDESIISMEIAQ